MTDLVSLRDRNLILFGEWCYACHSLSYQSLPDGFVGFYIHDRLEKCFYSIPRRNELLALLELMSIKPSASVLSQ